MFPCSPPKSQAHNAGCGWHCLIGWQLDWKSQCTTVDFNGEKTVWKKAQQNIQKRKNTAWKAQTVAAVLHAAFSIVFNTQLNFSSLNVITPLYSATGWWLDSSTSKTSPKTGTRLCTLPPSTLQVYGPFTDCQRSTTADSSPCFALGVATHEPGQPGRFL